MRQDPKLGHHMPLLYVMLSLRLGFAAERKSLFEQAARITDQEAS